MGFLGKLFEKKNCAICGGEIGLLGNRKLEDGNMCKTCARKLSPWFEDRRESTVKQIEEQLAYREENKKAVAAFQATRILGDDTEVYIDEQQGQFMLVQGDIEEENPDVVSLSQITGVDFDIDESRTEDKEQDDDGNYVSYQPPRYTYHYNYYITIRVRHPYFDEMKFKLNGFTVDVETTVTGGGLLGALLGASATVNRSYECEKYEEMGREIKEALLSGARQPAAQASAQPAAKFCPNCGTKSGGGKFCPNCGAQLG